MTHEERETVLRLVVYVGLRRRAVPDVSLGENRAAEPRLKLEKNRFLREVGCRVLPAEGAKALAKRRVIGETKDGV